MQSTTTFSRPREPDRTRNARASIWALLISEFMLFFGFLSSFFFLRSALPAWGPPTGRVYDLTLPLVNTVLLLASAATMYLSYRAIRQGEQKRFDSLLLVTMLLGAGFIIGQIIEFSSLGFSIRDGAYASIFLLTMGVHAFHVAVGVLIFAAVHLRASMGLLNAQRYLPVELCAIYWYFVALMWIVIFAILYFL
jgi:cytochrome c oxidase subunit 3